VSSIAEEGASQGTGEERVYTWKIGWHMFLDNPVMGVGKETFHMYLKI
jgi:O-antigen ligase